MNRLLGAISAGDLSSCVDTVGSWAGKLGAELTVFPQADKGVHMAVCDGGSVLGVAQKGSLHLTYLGWINNLPETTVNPLDKPDVTAELLLDRFISHEHGFLDGVGGSFILVLRDLKSGRVIVARDPSGDRRIFVSYRDGNLYYASHLSDYQFLFGDTLEMNRATEEFHLAYEFLPDDNTLYTDVFVLGAGKIIDHVDGNTSEYSIAAVVPLQIDEQDLQFETVSDTLEDLMLSTLEQQIPSEGKIAVLLGGFDSALIASMLKRMGRDIETFTFQYEDETYNQAYVNELADYLGTTHNWVPINRATLGEGLQHFAECFNQPVSQAHYPINSLTACNAMRERGFTYCLTGDGCDGIFLGYPTVHQRATLIRMLARVSWLLAPLRYIARIPSWERVLGHPYRIARNVLRMLNRELPARAYISACSVDDFSYSQLLESGRVPQTIDSENTIVSLAEHGRGHSIVRMAYMGKGHVGLNRTKLEGCSSAAGIVLNSPFLHPSLKRFSQLLPEKFLRPEHEDPSNATGKYALMRMAELKGYLPSEIIHQPKMSPVTAPVDAWYMTDLKAPIKTILQKLPFDTSAVFIESLFSDKLSERLFRKHLGISRYTSNVLSMLTTYASFSDDTRNN